MKVVYNCTFGSGSGPKVQEYGSHVLCRDAGELLTRSHLENTSDKNKFLSFCCKNQSSVNKDNNIVVYCLTVLGTVNDSVDKMSPRVFVLNQGVSRDEVTITMLVKW